MKYKTKLRVNDMVKIISGGSKGQSGKILEFDRERNRVLVEGCNMVSKSIKPRSAEDKGGIIKKEAFIHCSNVAILEKGNTTRIGYKFDESGKKVRFSKKSGELL